MAKNSMNNLTTLIKRLEAATSRLEDIASSATSIDVPRTNGQATSASTRGGRAPNAQPPAPAPSSAVPQDLPAAVEDFDILLNEDVQDFVNKTQPLDGPVIEQALAVLRAFKAQRRMIFISTKAKKPEMSAPVYMDILKDLQHEMQIVGDLREANRQSPFKDHLSMVGDGIGALSWVAMEGKPAGYIEDVFGGAQFYGNRVLKEYKDKEGMHVQYVQAFYKIFKSLASYIKAHYATGLTWNMKDGVDPAQALREAQGEPQPVINGTSATPPVPGGGAPPPPPPPMPNFDNVPPPPPQPAAKSGGATDMGAVFDEINQGEAVTAGLKKVDKSQMTHKNPALRSSATVPSRNGSSSSARGKSATPPTKPKPEGMRTKKPPKKELDGNKWLIENFENEQQVVEVNAEIQHSILITKCKQITLRINGKCNAISVDNSSRVSLVVDSLVSAVDVIKSPNFALQVLGSLPTVMLDHVDGGTIYLSDESLHTEIYTSKCTSININLPPASEEDDYAEHPLPEQIRNIVKDGKIVSEIVEHAG